MEYRVSWEIDVDAESHKEAAHIARDMQLNPKSTATVFKVKSSRVEKELDIGFRKPEEMFDIRFALFNRHVNEADVRAKDAFLALYDQDAWDKHIQPFDDKGIMSILSVEPNKFIEFYVFTIYTMVNKF